MEPTWAGLKLVAPSASVSTSQVMKLQEHAMSALFLSFLFLCVTQVCAA